MRRTTGIRGRHRGRGEKMSLYLPGDVLEDIRAEARRQQRSVSWLVRSAWLLARKGIDALPSVPELGNGEAHGPVGRSTGVNEILGT
jgi:uncharacterized small protein (TIGR04563 family)